MESLLALHRRSRFRRWFGVHLAAALALFLAGVAFGAFVVAVIPVKALLEMAKGAESPLPERLTFWAIFSNNLVAVGVTFMGSVTLGLLSAAGLFFNGFVLGAVGTLALERVPPLVFLALVVPHGILEIPAFLVVGAFGLRIAHRIARYALGYDETPLTRVEVYELAALLVAVSITIAVAAYVEVAYTPAAADLVS